MTTAKVLPLPFVKPEDRARHERLSMEAAITVPDNFVEGVKERRAKWQTFENLGLVPEPAKKAKKATLASLIVNLYRLLGFAILTLIVVVLVGYIGRTVFYYVNHSWITPIAVSPSDERVVALRAQLAEQQNNRDRIAAELAQTDRAIAAEQAYQGEFAKAIRSDLDGRRQALGKIKGLATAAGAAWTSVSRTNEAYAGAARKQYDNEYAAGLIDKNRMLSATYELSQISGASLSLAERQADYELRAQDLASQARSLDAILSSASSKDPLSYDVLKIKRDFQASELVLAKGKADRDVLKASLARQDQIIKGLLQSAYLRSIEDHATVAFVPYEHMDNVKKGTVIYHCKLGLVMCSEVGSVVDVLQGEVTFKHPRRDQMLRGRMVEMRMTDEGAAEDDVLFMGHAPLGF